MSRDDASKKQEKHILVFNLLNEEFGADISYVREVLNIQEIHPLSQAPNFIEGVISLREHIFAVMDLKKKFGIKGVDNSPQKRIIICKVNKFIIGLIVDGVSDVIGLDEMGIQSALDVVPVQAGNSFVSGIAKIDDRIITILNMERILTEKEERKLECVKR